ncbi:glycoside hydrolase family 15 protein [Planctomicrobium sp. SH668]|uniref:glycoside hydrolase family 15 protein n=1 Tax=Planctomicrobium sp. SH668 TaxID=3448126 RepID=UPI003F5AF8FF
MSTVRPGMTPDLSLSDFPTEQEVDQVIAYLEAQGTFQFPTISTGLFSAAAAENPEFRLTGYQYIWTRDNCHIAHALWIAGKKEIAAKAVRSLLTFYSKHAFKFSAIIDGETNSTDPMNRPHIRFDGESLNEIEVRWAHAQNDALGYTLWLACKLIRSGDLIATESTLQLFNLFVRYFAKIRYFEDEDSGHWEESRKIEASSIGPVVAGLQELRSHLSEQHSNEVDLVLLNELIDQGWRSLHEILPAECIQSDPTKGRRYDAALLFLIYPLKLITGELATQIMDETVEHLGGPIGIRRYNGDSYWCANYRELLSAEVRTTDFSDDMSVRDRLLKPGEEAQWCIFDPILSVIYGNRFQESGQVEDAQKQQLHLRRALKQLTDDKGRFPANRCPESYFLEKGEWIPNDITPLLWTQANLLLALLSMRKSAAIKK